MPAFLGSIIQGSYARLWRQIAEAPFPGL